MSTIVTFGGATFMKISQENADKTMELVLERGINHIDVAPEYGEAEIRLGSWIEKHRENIFLGCKTGMRKKAQAKEELYRSLEHLHTDFFDLYQLHGVDDFSELDTALGVAGAIEVILEARTKGLVKYIGITSHYLSILIKALKMFEFDTVMFPFNFIFYSDTTYRKEYEKLMKLTAKKDIGVMVIKAIAKGNWKGIYEGLSMLECPYTTWYEPFDTKPEIERSIHFALSQKICTVVSASDVRLLPLIIDAADSFKPMSTEKQNLVLEEASVYKPLEFTF
ncbi:MAG: aldo/keto reductase [Spirochaetota bacterium]|nr:MAG: aldo/keto reductase [Spirochaetota bacterium]